MLFHGVVIYGEDTYRKKVVFHLSALKPKAEMVSEASTGCYDFWQTWKYHRPLSPTKSDKLKKQDHQDNSKTIRPGFKAQDPDACRVLSPIMLHEIRWSPWKVWKSVFQTNHTKELKTQGTECLAILKALLEDKAWLDFITCLHYEEVKCRRPQIWTRMRVIIISHWIVVISFI